MNREWTARNKMPKNARMEQRVRWHEEHARECVCRPVPPTVQAAIDKKRSRG